MQCPLVSDLWQQAMNARLKMYGHGQDCHYLLSEWRSLGLLWDVWICRMLFPAALPLGGIPLQEKNLNSTCACTGKPMLVFTFHPVKGHFHHFPLSCTFSI